MCFQQSAIIYYRVEFQSRAEGDDEGQLHEEGFEHIARMFAFCGKVDLQGPGSNLHARQSFSGGIDYGVVRIRCLSRPLARSLARSALYA